MIESTNLRNIWSYAASLLLTSVLLSIASAVAFGQAASGTGAISGLVTDPSGSVMPGVQVLVRNVDTNVTRELASNDAGRYEAPALQPGNYEVKASKSGFATLARTGITLSVGERAVVDIAMQISSTAETVTVDANASMVETDKTDVSSVVNLKDVMNLPMTFTLRAF